MEDAQKLIVELLAKLGELDSKVANYQQDMLAQFKKYSDDLLKDVPEAVSSEVARAIAESMSKYPSLNPPSSRDDGVESQPPTPSDADWKAWDGRKSPPPVLYHTSGIPKMFRVVDGGDRSPHERDREFRGVFTPSYLPLLDDSDRPPRSSPASLRSTNPPAIPQAAPPATFPLLPESVAVETEHVEEVVVPEPQTDKGKGKEAVRPIPVRSLTDTTIHSVSSSGSGSESKTRRSALRRSSSSNKGSPRRVRFEFGGTEVLPSSSPETVFSSSQPHVSLDEAENDDIRASSAIDDSELYSSEPYNGPSLLDIEGEEDFAPRPKKVSSTQALRELTRSPFEEGTIWNVVNSDIEGSIARTNGGSEATGSSDLTPTNSTTAISGSKSQSKGPTAAKTTEQPHLNESLGSPLQEMERYTDDDESSEEEFLSMRPKSSKSPSPATRSPRERSPAAREPEPKSTEAPQKTTTANKGQSRADIERLSSRPYAVRVADPEDFASVWETSVVPLVTDILKENVDCDYSVDVHNYPELKSKSVHRVIFVTLPVDISDDLRVRMQAELAKKIPPRFQGTYLQFLCPKDLSSSRGPTQVEENEVFDWEDDGSRNLSKAEKYLPEVEEEETVEETETEPETPTESTIYSRSPAVTIPRRDAPTTTAMKTRFSEGGIGSYKGNSVRMDVVANPRVLEEAAALGDLKSFVGSVNGNSGFDPSDINSYRESLGKHTFSGTPRSFSERVMLEDRMALEKGDEFEDDEFANQY